MIYFFTIQQQKKNEKIQAQILLNKKNFIPANSISFTFISFLILDSSKKKSKKILKNSMNMAISKKFSFQKNSKNFHQ